MNEDFVLPDLSELIPGFKDDDETFDDFDISGLIPMLENNVENDLIDDFDIDSTFDDNPEVEASQDTVDRSLTASESMDDVANVMGSETRLDDSIPEIDDGIEWDNFDEDYSFEDVTSSDEWDDHLTADEGYDSQFSQGFNLDPIQETVENTEIENEDDEDIFEWDELAAGALDPPENEAFSDVDESVSTAPVSLSKKKKSPETTPPKSEKQPESKKSFLDKFKEKFAAFKAQAAAEFQGKDAPEPKTVGSELAVIDDNDEETEDEEDKPRKKKSKGSKPLSKVFKPFINLYMAIVNFIFKFIDGILGFLAKIPLIGWPFKMLKQFSQILKMIATSLPLLLVVAGLVTLNIRAVPSETTVELPDMGAAVFTGFKFDASENIVSGEIKNVGEVNAVVEPVFTVYSMQFTLNPKTWIFPMEEFECVSELVSVDIDASETVQAKCEKTPEGLFPRVTGTLK